MKILKLSIFLAMLLVPSLIIVGLLWFPFGFALTGLIEEWDILGLFTQHGLFFLADVHSPLSGHAIRPLTILPFSVAYYLDPNSFYYWHVLQILALILKGSSFSYLIWKATDRMKLSMLAGILVLIYPAETMQLSFRSLHINWALALTLFSSCIFIAAMDSKNKFSAYLNACIASALLFASFCFYEASLTLFIFPWVINFVRHGLRATIQWTVAKASLCIIWMLSIAGYISYIIFVSHKFATYQNTVIGNKNKIVIIFHNIGYLFSPGMLRSLLGGWVDAIQIFFLEYSSYLYLMASVSIVVVILYVLGKINKSALHGSQQKNTKVTIKRLIISGFLLLCLGYAPFLLSRPHMSISQRIYLFATPGTVMVWIAVIFAISQYKRLFAAFISIAMLTFGLASQLFQFHYYVELSQIQRSLLRNIVENSAANLDGKSLVIFDKTNQIGRLWTLMQETLTLTLSYIYGQNIPLVKVCYLPSMESVSAFTNIAAKCVKNNNLYPFKYPNPALNNNDFVIDNNKFTTITIDDERNKMNNHYINILKTENTALALRYRGILQDYVWPFKIDMFEDQKLKDNLVWTFGRWWSLDLPVQGTGWQGTYWKVKYFFHKSFAWKSQEKSSIYFKMAPTNDMYILRIKFTNIKSQEICQSMRIFINKHLMQLHSISKYEVEAQVPSGILHLGLNQIEFNSKINEQEPSGLVSFALRKLS